MHHFKGRRDCAQRAIVVALLLMASVNAATAEMLFRVHHSNAETLASGIRTMEIPAFSSTSRRSRSWEDVVGRSKCPQDLCKAVAQKIQYTPDMYKDEEWLPAEDVWKKGKGDCEDFATALLALCEEKNFDAHIFVLQSKLNRKAHAVVIGRWNDHVWASSNGSYQVYACVYDAKAALSHGQGWWAPEVAMFQVEDQGTEVHRHYVTASPNNPRY